MFRPPFLKLPLIILALASCASAHAQSAPNAATVTNANTPVTFSCDIPGPQPRTILVPAGKLPSDVCPGPALCGDGRAVIPFTALPRPANLRDLPTFLLIR
jgi:hypothetical protein